MAFIKFKEKLYDVIRLLEEYYKRIFVLNTFNLQYITRVRKKRIHYY
jgi:hypothetical protein